MIYDWHVGYFSVMAAEELLAFACPCSILQNNIRLRRLMEAADFGVVCCW